MSAFSTEPVHVRVPATSANLGPGFDALGLALQVYDDLVARVRPSGLAVGVDGEGADVARDENHLVVKAIRAAFDEIGAQPPGLELTCHNRIPHGRGLGSSAAAIVAGIALARGLVEDGCTALPDDAALALADRLEGHPDNVAAAQFGGLTIAWRDPDSRARATRLEYAQTIRTVVLIPPSAASTEQARGLLPAVVSHADAAANAGRAALLVAALTVRPALLFDATEDRLHQSYREPALAGSLALMRRLRAAGLPAVVSGAGPTVLVLTRASDEVQTALAAAPAGWLARERAVSGDGVRRVG